MWKRILTLCDYINQRYVVELDAVELENFRLNSDTVHVTCLAYTASDADLVQLSVKANARPASHLHQQTASIMRTRYLISSGCCSRDADSSASAAGAARDVMPDR